MFERVLGFGCSHIYGLGLPDCPTVWDKPSQFSFLNILANKLNAIPVNLSDTGASQKQIAATVLQTDIRDNDLVLIHWADITRRGLWDGRNWNQFGSWNTDRTVTKFFAKYSKTEDDVLETNMYIDLANYYLQGKCKKIINSMHDTKGIKFNKIDISWNDHYLKKLPCGHPDGKSHKKYAEKIYTCLN